MTAPSVNGRSLTTLRFFNFFIYGAMAIFNTFFPLYLKEVGVSNLAVGMLLAGGPLISVIANPFWGYWSDRMQNIKRTMIIMLVCNLVVAQVVFNLKEYVFLYAAMLVFYFFQTPIFSQSNSLILNAIEGTNVKFGSIRQWGSLGWAIMSIGAGPVLEWLGIGYLWLPFSAGILITLAFTVTLPKGESGGKFSNAGYRNVFTNRYFLAFILLGILVSVPNSMNSTFIAIYISDMGGHANLIGLSTFFAAIFEAAIFLLFDRFMKKSNTFMIACLLGVSLLFCLRWVLMAMATSPIQLIFIQSLHCLTFGGYFYVGTQFTAKLVPKAYRASGQAAFALTWGGISGFFAGFLGGWLYEHMGAQAMYAAGSILALGGAAGFLVLLVKIRKLGPESAAES